MESKGEFNGKCNITRCETGIPATWYNHSTRLFYCKECAIRLNNDVFNKRYSLQNWDHDLCTEGEPQKD